MRKNKKENTFQFPKNEHGFVCYSTKKEKKIKPKTLKDLYQNIMIPLCIENDKIFVAKAGD